jgi:hypothetical protein
MPKRYTRENKICLLERFFHQNPYRFCLGMYDSIAKHYEIIVHDKYRKLYYQVKNAIGAKNCTFMQI